MIPSSPLLKRPACSYRTKANGLLLEADGCWLGGHGKTGQARWKRTLPIQSLQRAAIERQQLLFQQLEAIRRHRKWILPLFSFTAIAED